MVTWSYSDHFSTMLVWMRVNMWLGRQSKGIMSSVLTLREELLASFVTTCCYLTLQFAQNELAQFITVMRYLLLLQFSQKVSKGMFSEINPQNTNWLRNSWFSTTVWIKWITVPTKSYKKVKTRLSEVSFS
jgi:hypothetical protein